MPTNRQEIVPDLDFWVRAAKRRLCHPTPDIIVAIPAKDEAARIEPCLEALAHQVGFDGRPLPPGSFGILLLLNNCRDDTADKAARYVRRLPFALWIVECELPASLAHAGGARRLAMDAAAGWLIAGEATNGAILTTDADSIVAPDWVVRHREGFAQNSDALAGLVLDDPEEHRGLPLTLRRRGRLEDRYGALLTELKARLDPEVHDPWPCHAMASGASLGVTLAAYRSVGGLPLQPFGEDRALIQALVHRDARIRHCPAIQVTTSCRLVGRAEGGMADAIRQRIADPDALCDEMLEPLLDALHRHYWRATLRRRHAAGCLSGADDWAAFLGVAETAAAQLVQERNFGTFWHQVERLSPMLRHHRLRPSELLVEIKRTRGVLRWLRCQEASPPVRIAAAS